MQINFQAGVEDIYDACVAKGSTPSSTSLSDVIAGIMAIPSGIDPASLTYTNFTADNIKSGTTISVSDGSSTLKSVTGTYVTAPVLIGTYSGTKTISVASYKRSTDTVNNFMVEYYSISSGYTEALHGNGSTRAYLKSFSLSKSLSGTSLKVTAAGTVTDQYNGSEAGNVWKDWRSANVTVSYKVYHI